MKTTYLLKLLLISLLLFVASVESDISIEQRQLRPPELKFYVRGRIYVHQEKVASQFRAAPVNKEQILTRLGQPASISLHTARTPRSVPSETGGGGSASGSGGQLSESELTYINEQCQGASFAEVVPVSLNDDLWSKVRSYIDTEGTHFDRSHYVRFNRGGINPWSWSGQEADRRGVLFVLPQGSDYLTTDAVFYYYFSDDDTNKLISPRIGLCGLSGDNKAVLKMKGRAISDGHHETGWDLVEGGGGVYVAPLYGAQTQFELYNLHVNADEVHPRNAALEVHYGGKLFLKNVTLSRVGGQPESYSGLILSFNSLVSIDEVDIKQTTDSGVSIYMNDYSELVSSDSSFIANKKIWSVVSVTSMINLENNRFDGITSDDISPIAVSTAVSQDENIHKYCTADNYDYCQNNPNASIIADGERAVCESYVRYCEDESSVVTMNNNRFSGNWYTLVDVPATRFHTSAGNSLDGANFLACSTDPSSALTGDLLFSFGSCFDHQIATESTEAGSFDTTSSETASAGSEESSRAMGLTSKMTLAGFITASYLVNYLAK